MNKRQARAHACYLVAAWAQEVVNGGGLTEETTGWSEADALKIEEEVTAITEQLFNRWFKAGAPSRPHHEAVDGRGTTPTQ